MRLHILDITLEYENKIDVFDNMVEFINNTIRKFNLEPLGQETISDILNFTGSVETLFEDIKWEVRILKPEEITGFYMVKAPH